MTVLETMRQLQLMIDDDPDNANREVVINPDITNGKFKAMPQNRSKRYSYHVGEITNRTLMTGGQKQDVVCIELGLDSGGSVNPLNLVR